jgi:FAD/FMN-containing dehydrogenase
MLAGMTTDTLTTTLARGLRVRGFTGELVEPQHPEYDAARRVWNGAIDRRPAAVARCADADDVAAAIGAARSAGLPLAVRGGGHSMPGHSVCEGGLVVDLCGLRSVSVDPARRRARVGGGALLGDVDRATHPHGLAVPAGHISHTGVAGLTLGGGTGWLMRKHGLTIDSLLEVEMVTADGRTVRASESEHPELFWALRGGGGNFGVVTEFVYRLHEVGPAITAGLLVFPFERAGEALRASRARMADAPDELTIYEVLISAPPAPPFPADLHGRPVAVIGVAHAGTPQEAERDLAQLRALGPALDLVEPMPHVAMQTMLDDTAPPGLGQYSRYHWLTGMSDEAIEVVLEHFAWVPSPLSQVLMGRLGGAVARVPAETTAFGHRDAGNQLWIVGTWAEGDGHAERAWARGLHEATERFSTGVYVNGLGDEPGERVRAAYDAQAWERLVAVKDAWDPENVFRFNQNIPPSGG